MTEKEHILVADDERNIRKNAGSGAHGSGESSFLIPQSEAAALAERRMVVKQTSEKILPFECLPRQELVIEASQFMVA
jgi:hypothetical protein